jgi:hypothetical protein
MSVDVLFAEAAESGGPPHFTEDEVEHRVDQRRRRRRGLMGAGALAVVLAGGALGLRLASQDPADEVTAGPTDVALTDTRWVATGPELALYSVVPWIDFREDGTFTIAAACGRNVGAWDRRGDELTFRLTEDEELPCPLRYEPVEDAIGSIESGRVVDGEIRIDGYDRVAFRRLDDWSAPAEEDLVDDWYSPAGGALELEENGEAWLVCHWGTWSVDGSTFHLTRVENPSNLGCGSFRDQFLRPFAYDGATIGLDRGTMVLSSEDQVMVLRRTLPPETAESVARYLSDSFSLEGGCCGGAAAVGTGFIQDDVEVSVSAGWRGQRDGAIRDAAIETVLDGHATFSQAPRPDGRWVMVGFACEDVVVAVSSQAPGTGVRAAVTNAAAALINALPCEARPAGPPCATAASSDRASSGTPGCGQNG